MGDHSGDCIHSPVWGGEYDDIVITPVVHDGSPNCSDGSKYYYIAFGWSESSGAWVCNNCANSPGYFAQYFLYRLAQMSVLEEGTISVPS